MVLFHLREPINALSHCAGMMLAMPVTWVLWKRCSRLKHDDEWEPASGSSRYQNNQGALCMLIFGRYLDRLLRRISFNVSWGRA